MSSIDEIENIVELPLIELEKSINDVYHFLYCILKQNCIKRNLDIELTKNIVNKLLEQLNAFCSESQIDSFIAVNLISWVAMKELIGGFKLYGLDMLKNLLCITTIEGLDDGDNHSRQTEQCTKGD